jgi:hypothetical protein
MLHGNVVKMEAFILDPAGVVDGRVSDKAVWGGRCGSQLGSGYRGPCGQVGGLQVKTVLFCRLIFPL